MGCTQSKTGTRAPQQSNKNNKNNIKLSNAKSPVRGRGRRDSEYYQRKRALIEAGDIAPFSPSSSLCRRYETQIEEGKKLFHAPAPIQEEHNNHSNYNYNNIMLGASKGRKKKTLTSDDNIAGWKHNNNNNNNNNNIVTLYRVAPIRRLIGRGLYSEVSLADLTVHTTTADALAKEGVESHTKHKRSNSNLTSLKGEANVEEIVEPKYLIACKEYPLIGDSAPFIYNRLQDEVRRLTRLAFSARLLKVLQMESVYDNPNNNNNNNTTFTTTYTNTLSGGAAGLDVLVDESHNNNNNNNSGGIAPITSSEGTNKSIGSTGARGILRKLSSRASGVQPPRTPNKVRIYMEYAKYGTLRNLLINETPKKFGKTYMHELTVRAYLREVLVALAFLHENNVVHTDLCAKNVYLVNDIINIYATCFPAYIADIPAGRFAKVPSQWIRRILALMDPASMQPQYDSEHIGHLLNDSVVSHLGWNPAEEITKQNITQGEEHEGDGEGQVSNVAPAVNDPTIPGQTRRNSSAEQPKSPMNNNNNNNNIEDNEPDDGRFPWLDDEVRLYLHENAYTDNESLPLLSPLSNEESVNVFKSPHLDGLTIVRSGSFARAPRMPALPPALASLPSALSSSSPLSYNNNNNNNNNKTSIAEQNGDRSKQYSFESPQFGSSNFDHGEINSPYPNNNNNTLGRLTGKRQKRKPLIKLGHYGKIRAILVGDGGGTSNSMGNSNAHKFGRVTHIAPENMQRASPNSLTPASDIYAFAMTFIELTTPNGGIFSELSPKNVPPPRTRQEKDAYDAQWLLNIKKYLRQHNNAIPLPPQLSEECKAMLRWCLQYDPAKRPTAVELLQSKYFLLGHWVTVATRRGGMEAPWHHTNYEAAAQASGLPRLPSTAGLYKAGERELR